MITVYVAGGIAGLEPDEVTSRFNYLQEQFELLGCQVKSPIRGKIIDTEVEQRYETNEIIDRDLWDIRNADILIAVPSVKSIGTWMEIFFAAHEIYIPVIVVADNNFIRNHYWVRKFASKIVSTMDEAIEYVGAWYL